MSGLIALTIIAVVGMVVITVIFLADHRDERNYYQLKAQTDELQRQIEQYRQERENILKRLSEIEQSKKSFRHSELIDLDNAIGSILGIETRKEDLREQAKIIDLKAEALSRQIETAYQILWTLRGRDKKENGKPPGLSNM